MDRTCRASFRNVGIGLFLLMTSIITTVRGFPVVTNPYPLTLERSGCLCADFSTPHCLNPLVSPGKIVLPAQDESLCICADGTLANCDTTTFEHEGDEPPVKPRSMRFWYTLAGTIVLVLIGGIFAGLTIGIMSLDTTNLQILKNSGTEKERKYAAKIEPIRKHGHWVLTTLLLGNVVINETLPILFHSIVGGGLAAIIISTALVVLFGEIIPNAICARHGLAVGATLTPLVRVCMWILFPVAYPIAKLLDYLLGHSEGTIYARAQLKTLVALHEEGYEGNGQSGELIHDEVGIISAVLDLKDKTVRQIMTPLEDVFMLEASQVVDVELIKQVIGRGHSRVPVYQRNRSNLVAILLVKRLIGYNVEKAKRINDFPLTYLPIVDDKTSLFDMLNFFQEGRSHMAAVAGYRVNDWLDINGQPDRSEREILGVITLEDVIEELIGEEIIDETDEYIDVHSKTPVMRTPITKALAKLLTPVGTKQERTSGNAPSPRITPTRRKSTSSGKPTTRRGRRAESASRTDPADNEIPKVIPEQPDILSEGDDHVDNVPSSVDYFATAVDPQHSRDERLHEAGWVVTPMNPAEPESRGVLSRRKVGGSGVSSAPPSIPPSPTLGKDNITLGEGGEDRESRLVVEDERTPLLK
ncbi:uncharacterized protein SPPG_00632 [Spizellomyces punctatus DAOM BR117]|uniref:CNNM transmembrane domain-containing protein n=1 Tax=Spizellomyces punctatus (strain DAOM BR117) TaxID=645134 RepID=A0A0L0HV25_SPIPD|nr:uncharacterized protein SPPG_00632 [Spizellomyces punctatus DAOM BR117]KND04942.1 hypothetical protein SPPG_00632 [Spizellomyces punctatus DAOM BR117]|eukprot:XP_016612981.1 hypothetical protein SPPG_00632 [Spizellomyces punctatus DAOM BR117]